MAQYTVYALAAFFLFARGNGALACDDAYPPSMVKAFMANCTREAQWKGYCGCVIDTVQKTIPLYDFIEVGAHAGGINADPRYVGANQSCAKAFPLSSGIAVTRPSQ